MKITNRKTSVEDKLAWKKIVEQAKTYPGLWSWLRRRRRSGGGGGGSSSSSTL